MADDYEVFRALKRIETKLVRFAEELGVPIDVEPDWLTVDDDSRTIYVSTLGRSLLVMRSEAIQRGATQKGKFYDIVYRGDTHGTLHL